MQQRKSQQEKAEIEKTILSLAIEGKEKPREIMAKTGQKRHIVYGVLRKAKATMGKQGNYKFSTPEELREAHDKILEMFDADPNISKISRETGYSREWIYKLLEKNGRHVKGRKIAR